MTTTNTTTNTATKIFSSTTQQELKILFIAPAKATQAVYATGFLDKLITLYPRAHITIAASFASAPLFAAAPFAHIERIVAWKAPCAARALPKLIFKKWDMIIDCERVPTLPFCRSRQKVTKSQLATLNHKDFTPHIWLADELIRGAEHRLLKKTKVLGVAPFTDKGTPIMPLPDLLHLLKVLTAAGGVFASSPIAVFGFEPSRAAAESQILRHFPDWQRINLVGSLGLLSIDACLQKCLFFLGGDSVISHMSAVSNIASVIIENTDSKIDPPPQGRYTKITTTIKAPELIALIDDFWHTELKQK